ncbi:hypothetical protein KFE25_007648 [Diacronema lutheri]|uniref:Uncharacterized protein n=1 Tax=Diacronema lutheri TaxID=2081491 RepID=A0A8J6CGH6_DIALT|nr:hypothetical protein KFE25_007648 [Diacronema lutheri]
MTTATVQIFKGYRLRCSNPTPWPSVKLDQMRACTSVAYAPVDESEARQRRCRGRAGACVAALLLAALARRWCAPLTSPHVAWAEACGASDVMLAHLARCAAAPASAERLQLWGERHSGTNAAERLIRTNFRVKGTLAPHGFKHMWMTNRTEHVRAWQAQLARSVARRTPTVVMTREPYRWILSMHARPHHQPWLRRLPLSEFVRHEWLLPPIRELPGELEPTDEECRRKHAGEVARAACERARATPAFGNVLEMRTAKLQLLVKELMPPASAGAPASSAGVQREVVPRVAFVRQEELVDGGLRVACRLLRELRLCPLGESVRLVPGTVNPGGGYWSLLRWAPSRRCAVEEMGPEVEPFVRGQLDWELEGSLGYAPVRC